jgi:hypothetical protein
MMIATLSPTARLRGATIAAALTLLLACGAAARVLMTQEQALASAFPPGVRVTRQTLFHKQRLVIRYAGSNGWYAYFDTHRVRTEAETIMLLVGPGGTLGRIEILSFNEPTDYFPKRRWLDQLTGRKLDDNLALNRAVRPMSGASLTGRAVVEAARRILALHGELPP